MNSIYFAAQIITVFRKKEKFKNNTVWVIWNEITKEVFRDKIHPSALKLFVYSGEADYAKIGNLENTLGIFSEFSGEDKKDAFTLLSLFHQLLKNEK